MPVSACSSRALMCVCPQRMDLGECVKVHDLALRADFEIASKQQEYFFELDVSFAAVVETPRRCLEGVVCCTASVKDV